MAKDLGKAFEKRFQQDWLRSFPGSLCLRLPDQMSGYYGASSNPCDFICYNYPTLYMLEIKSHLGNTFPLSALRQYPKLICYKGIDGIKAGVILWFRDHDKILYIPITTFEQLIKEKKKSVNIKMLTDTSYEIYEIPSKKKKTFLTADLTVLKDM